MIRVPRRLGTPDIGILQMIGQTTAHAAARQLDLNIEPVAATQPSQAAIGAPVADTLLLARAAEANGAARAEFLRDLIPLVSAAENRLAALVLAQLLTDSAGRVQLTATGRERLMTMLATKTLPKDWDDMRAHLAARALGVKLDAARKKALGKPDGLRAAILEKAFDLKLKGATTTARLRSSLAVVALERAFGNKVKAGLGTGTGLSPKAGRLLAGQLSKAPRDFGTDSRLVAALAAEQAGAASPEFEALWTAVIAKFASASVAAVVKTTRAKAAPAVAPVATSPANDPAPVLSPVLSPSALTPVPSLAKPAALAPDLSARPAASNRPDLAGFADSIKAIAKLRGEGWSGSRKSYIADVWEEVKVRFASWGLTEVEFKSMLAEAHRTGHVVLANADLKTKDNAARLAASAIVYKNTVWHFVRVED
jgi:hypothetical protein